MATVVNVVMEYNDKGYMLWAEHYPGAFTRGKTKEEALGKIPTEVRSYNAWRNHVATQSDVSVVVVQEWKTNLNVADADSDVIFDSEKALITENEYVFLKELVLKSAEDFRTLYASIPDKDLAAKPGRKTFHGEVPLTANAMMTHTNSTTRYYAAQLGVQLKNLTDICENRLNAISCIERLPGYLDSPVVLGDYEEWWSLKKVLRRFLWHDRIHAKAMYRMAVCLWGEGAVENPFCFMLESKER
ncbi:MAG: hypothetical protein ABFD13_03155 [Candidatus Cryosericum sp.]|nr:hypothetical protein [bacterium]